MTFGGANYQDAAAHLAVKEAARISAIVFAFGFSYHRKGQDVRMAAVIDDPWMRCNLEHEKSRLYFMRSVFNYLENVPWEQNHHKKPGYTGTNLQGVPLDDLMIELLNALGTLKSIKTQEPYYYWTKRFCPFLKNKTAGLELLIPSEVRKDIKKSAEGRFHNVFKEVRWRLDLEAVRHTLRLSENETLIKELSVSPEKLTPTDIENLAKMEELKNEIHALASLSTNSERRRRVGKKMEELMTQKVRDRLLPIFCCAVFQNNENLHLTPSVRILEVADGKPLHFEEVWRYIKILPYLDERLGAGFMEYSKAALRELHGICSEVDSRAERWDVVLEDLNKNSRTGSGRCKLIRALKEIVKSADCRKVKKSIEELDRMGISRSCIAEFVFNGDSNGVKDRELSFCEYWKSIQMLHAMCLDYEIGLEEKNFTEFQQKKTAGKSCVEELFKDLHVLMEIGKNAPTVSWDILHEHALAMAEMADRIQPDDEDGVRSNGDTAAAAQGGGEQVREYEHEGLCRDHGDEDLVHERYDLEDREALAVWLNSLFWQDKDKAFSIAALIQVREGCTQAELGLLIGYLDAMGLREWIARNADPVPDFKSDPKWLPDIGTLCRAHNGQNGVAMEASDFAAEVYLHNRSHLKVVASKPRCVA